MRFFLNSPNQKGLRSRILPRIQVKELLAALPKDGWTRLSADGAVKGSRWYNRFLLPINPPLTAGWRRGLPGRCQLDEPAEMTAFAVFATQGTELAAIVAIAGSRPAITVALEAAKDEQNHTSLK